MGFGAAISTCFKKYAVFSGRARRSEFWYWVLFALLVSIVANILDTMLGTRIVTGTVDGTAYVASYQPGWIGVIVYLALLLPGIAVAVRRLHDTNHSGWWWWLGLICCIGTIVLILAFYIKDSTEDNQYGPNPKGIASS